MNAKEVYEVYDRMLVEHYGVSSIEELLNTLYNQEKTKRRWSVANTSEVEGLTVVYNYLTPEEHEDLLEMALEEREHAGVGGARPHLMATFPHIPSLDLYLLYRVIFASLLKDGLIKTTTSTSPASSIQPPKVLTINYYKGNEGLAPHIDNPKVIGELIVGFSLNSSCVMDFEYVGGRLPDGTQAPEPQTKKFSIALRPGCVMIQQSPMRYSWSHGIQETSSQTDPVTGETIERGYRVSLQFSDFEDGFFNRKEVQQQYKLKDIGK